MTTPSLFFNRKNVNASKTKLGVSPVIATTIILAITITLGLSLWSFANSGIGAAASSYANVISDFGKYTKDNFVIANVAFDHPSANRATIWVYNSGETPTEIENVVISCKSCASFVPVSADLSQSIPAKSLQAVSFVSGALPAGNTYELKVISSTGAYKTQFQEK